MGRKPMGNLEKLLGRTTAAFYSGGGKNEGFGAVVTSAAIAAWTRCKYTHVELVFPDGFSYSSSGWDGGVRRKIITYSHPERWKFVTVDVGETPYSRKCRDRFDRILGKPYDHMAIWLTEVLPLKRENPNAWYCSESVKYALGLPRPWAVSPARLLREITPSPLYIAPDSLR